MNARLIFVHALSPLHAGTGQGVDLIDLPIAREKATGLPYLPGSSLKGTLRDACDDEATRKRIFGPDITNASEHAGSVQITDQRLLLLPMRSLAGTFAWVTSPFVLHRFRRDAQDGSYTNLPAVPIIVDAEQCAVAQSCALKLDGADGERVYLEDLDLHPTASIEVDAWAAWLGQHIFPNDSEWQTMLTERLCVVHDNVLSFLLTTATEVFARIRLKEDTKTVVDGGLWYEEALPAETVLAGLAVATPVKQFSHTPAAVLQDVADLTKQPLQLGGKATVGRGLCRVRMFNKGAAQ
jgi:CRISPR-associated protein Cmr4